MLTERRKPFNPYDYVREKARMFTYVIRKLNYLYLV